MKHTAIRRRAWFLALLTGIALINLALFLHPMSPEDFLELAFSDPLQSVFDAQGGAMAVFFWISIAGSTAALVGLLTSIRLFHRVSQHAKTPAMAH